MSPYLKLIINRSIYKIHLNDCGLSARAINVLKENEIQTIGDLFATPSDRNPLSENEMLRLRNCGKRTATEVSEFMSEINKYLNL